MAIIFSFLTLKTDAKIQKMLLKNVKFQKRLLRTKAMSKVDKDTKFNETITFS